MNGEEDGCSDIAIRVKRLDTLNINPYDYEEEFILVDRRTPMDHCMQVICTMINDVDGYPYFLCRDNKDSGSKSERYCHVSLYKTSNALYTVSIQIGLGDFGLDNLSINDNIEKTNSRLPNEPSIDETDSPNFSTKWKASYIPSYSKILQCISYAISECCKELQFYVPPDVVQSNIIGVFRYLYNRNLLESPAAPEEFNRHVLKIDTKDIQALGGEDVDPQIEVKVSEQKSFKLPKLYIWH